METRVFGLGNQIMYAMAQFMEKQNYVAVIE